MSNNKKRKRAPGFFHSQSISVISIAMVLFLMGVVAVMWLIGGDLKNHVRESVNFTILLSPESDPGEITAMKRALEREPFVKELEYYSKEQAMVELQKELGENPEEFLGWNPLSPTFEVYVEADYIANEDSIAIVEEALSGYPMTESLSFKHDLVSELNENISKLTIILLVLAALLLLISIVLINNTIRLLIYSKRFTIYTMRLVGATPSFIRRPFVRYNVWSGVVAAMIAMAFLAWGWWYVLDHYPLMRTLLTLDHALTVGAVVLLLGVVISWMSASWAVTRYLRMNVNKLYRV
ncbi:MAG: permease-like cell division protein FtsX [Porphyromonas sp.]|nr:permease-like cell division protein FtsX [Porphyromonas sp.]